MFLLSSQRWWANQASGFGICTSSGFVLALLLSAPVLAQVPADRTVYHNLQYTLRVRQAFLHDPQLAPLNLGVKVENRIAYLWGPVPSESLRRRALDLVRKLPDVLEVRSQIYVEEPDFSSPLYLPEPEKISAPLDTSATAPTAASQYIWQAAPVTPPVPPAITAMTEDVRFRPSLANIHLPGDPEEQEVRLHRPIAVPLTATHRITPASGTGSLEDQVRQELASQQRYRWLTAAVRNQMVYLDGAAHNWEDVHALARSLARLPGVERVVIEQITVLSENPPAQR